MKRRRNRFLRADKARTQSRQRVEKIKRVVARNTFVSDNFKFAGKVAIMEMKKNG